MKILLADDNADHRELIECALKENLVNVEVDSVDSGDEASNCLADPGNAYDLVLLDYNLPGNSGLEILQHKHRGADLHQPPVVMITGQGDEKVAAAAIKAGAYDYIVKDSDYLTRLPVVAQRAVDSRRLKIERQRVDEALRASQALNQAIINNAPIGISVRSKTGQLILANDAWKKIWAIPESAVIDDINRERHTLVFDQRDKYLQPYQEDLRQVYEQGADLVLPKLRTSNTSRPGSAAWVSQHFYALRDESGEVDRVVILTVDITERIQAEEKLKRWNEELEVQVNKRTRELRTLVDAMTGREARMADLKKVIKQLRAQVEAAGIEPVADDAYSDYYK